MRIRTDAVLDASENWPSAKWVDPRTDPRPPYKGPDRPLACVESEVAELVLLCRTGRLYEVESWIASHKPLQLDPARRPRRGRPTTPLREALAAGNFDLARLLLCNGYRVDVEPYVPLDDALDSRRWDLVDLLLEWGVDPASAELDKIFATYERAVFERFRDAGVDLTAGDAMAAVLATATRNRPLYGYAKNHRESDPPIQRALDVGLGAAVREESDKAVSLCLWAGADPRRRVGEISEDPEEDAEGMTALERAVLQNRPDYLSKFRFDPDRDDIEALYGCARDLQALRALVSIRPPAEWARITARFIDRLAFSVRLKIRIASLTEVEGVFALGGRLGVLERHEKRSLRRLLLDLDEWDAQRLFRLLRQPENMDPESFMDLIAHEKLAARYGGWTRRAGIDRPLLTALVDRRGIPAKVKAMARARLAPRHRPMPTHTRVRDGERDLWLSREELYELVWSEPMTALATRFGISDNGLRKRCKAMSIPTPSRGYWEKVKRGHRVRKLPFPPTPGPDGTHPPSQGERGCVEVSICCPI